MWNKWKSETSRSSRWSYFLSNIHLLNKITFQFRSHCGLRVQAEQDNHVFILVWLLLHHGSMVTTLAALKCESWGVIKTTTHKLHQRHNEISNRKGPEPLTAAGKRSRATNPCSVSVFSAVASLQTVVGSKKSHSDGAVVFCVKWVSAPLWRQDFKNELRCVIFFTASWLD